MNNLKVKRQYPLDFVRGFMPRCVYSTGIASTFFAVLFCGQASAQTDEIIANPAPAAASKPAAKINPSAKSLKAKKNKRFDFVPAPYLNYNRSFGGQVGAVPMVMYKINPHDKVSPPSMSGAVGYYSENGSWGLYGFSQWFMKEDQWRASMFFGTGLVLSQFQTSFPGQSMVDYEASNKYLSLEAKRKIRKNTFVGLNYIYTEFDNSFDTDLIPDNQSSLNGIGVMMNMDSRNNVYYPTDGKTIELRYTSYPKWLGNDEVNSIFKSHVNIYHPMRDDKDVLAIRAFVAAGLGDVPFNKELVMSGTDLRGYTQGQYRGKQKADIQVEYRRPIKGKVSGVAFAGVGSVFGSIVDDNNGKVLPSAGAGLRYNVFPQMHMNIGLDVAAARDDWGMYFRIGEAF